MHELQPKSGAVALELLPLRVERHAGVSLLLAGDAQVPDDAALRVLGADLGGALLL
jgi:hypothetical protein